MADEKSYLLRVEAVNLGNFITDSDDLSTIRGAGLLLLNAGRFLCGRSDVKEELASRAGLFQTADGAKWTYDGRIELDLLSAGASITLLSFRATEPDARHLQTVVADWLRSGGGQGAARPELRHATFAVELVPLSDKFSQPFQQSLMRVRLAQMRSPNVSFGPLAAGAPDDVPTGFCDIDLKRSRGIDLKKQPHDAQHLDGSSYARAADKNYASPATHHRRAYGRTTKVSVYQMVGKVNSDERAAQTDDRFPGFRPAWEFEEIAHRGPWRADGDVDIDGRDPYGEAKDKMAVIYIDGNGFGKLLRSLAKTAAAYQQYDQQLRDYRRDLMRRLVTEVKSKPYWRVKPRWPDEDPDEKTRIETLLWGGDELIWVVPAWCGLEAVQFFFDQTASWQLNQTRLTHAVGLVICSHKSPIRSVVALAKELAEEVKRHLPDLGAEAIARGEISAETKEFQHQACGNALAYEVLESFDHLGRDFQEARRDLRFPQMSDTDVILTEQGLKQLVEHLAVLKHGGKDTPRIPRRRVHQIAQVLHREPLPARGKRGAGGAQQGVPSTAYQKLVERIAQTTGGGAAYQDLLNAPLHWQTLDRLPAKWFHLLELWNYAAYPPSYPAAGTAATSPPQEARP
mgnify:CR=1 FL=1